MPIAVSALARPEYAGVRRQAVEPSTRGEGAIKEIRDQPHALPIDKMSERRKTGGAAAQGPRHAKKAGQI